MTVAAAHCHSPIWPPAFLPRLSPSSSQTSWPRISPPCGGLFCRRFGFVRAQLGLCFLARCHQISLLTPLRVRGAAQHAAKRSGALLNRDRHRLHFPCYDPGSAVHHFVSHRVRDDALHHFLRILLCGLRLPILPLSLPAAGSIAALIKVGRPESIASLTARLSSSGVVTYTPTPPNASIIFS